MAIAEMMKGHQDEMRDLEDVSRTARTLSLVFVSRSSLFQSRRGETVWFEPPPPHLKPAPPASQDLSKARQEHHVALGAVHDENLHLHLGRHSTQEAAPTPPPTTDD